MYNIEQMHLVNTEFTLIRCVQSSKLIETIPSLEPGTNQYREISVKFLAQGNNSLSVQGFYTCG